MTNVFIAAPTPMMRAGLRAMLETDDLRVIGAIVWRKRYLHPVEGDPEYQHRYCQRDQEHGACEALVRPQRTQCCGELTTVEDH